MLIPAIPPKLLGNASLALCEPRKRLLTQFLTRLGFDVLLRQDPAVFAFISLAEDAVMSFKKPCCGTAAVLLLCGRASRPL